MKNVASNVPSISSFLGTLGTVIIEVPRRSRSQIFFKIGVIKYFEIFTGKNLWWKLFLIKLYAFRPAALLKRDSNTDIFL